MYLRSDNNFDAVFEKKFRNFCSKSPLTLDFRLVGDKVIVFNHSVLNESQAKTITFDLDYSLGEKENIKNIKDELVKLYPIVFKITEEKLSDNEIVRLVKEEDIPLEEALTMKTPPKQKDYFKIVRVLNDKNQVIVENLENGDLELRSLRTPVTLFIKQINEDPERGSDTFFQSNKFIKKLNRRDQ